MFPAPAGDSRRDVVAAPSRVGEPLVFPRWLRTLPLPAILLVLPAAGPSVFAQDAPQPRIAREHHPWARFEPGAWRTTELTTETLDSDGEVIRRTVTTGRASLEAFRDQRYSLQQESIVDSRGRQVNGSPLVSWHNMFVDDASDTQAEELPESKVVLLNGRRVTCRVLRVRLTGRNQPRVANILYDQAESPYILRRESHIVQDDPETESAWKSVEEVVAVDMPYPFRNEVLSTAHMRTVVTTAKGRTVRMAIVCDTVPGGVIAEWSKELDRNGKVLR